MTAKERLLDALITQLQTHPRGLSAIELSDTTGLDRSSVSRYLNQLTREGIVLKQSGKPVRFTTHQVASGGPGSATSNTGGASGENFGSSVQRGKASESEGKRSVDLAFDRLVGASMSLSMAVQQAKAAILYPPRGLHTLILGETGVGKSLFAEMMFHFAQQVNMLPATAPFVRFNCADYADNPQLLMSQIFGVKKGAFTGANEDRVGLLKKADGGMLFLDEVHRLTPQGQEMLFTYMDKGTFRRMGDTESVVSSEVQLIAATTEDPASVLLKTFMRRIPMTITLPALRERELEERYHLVAAFLKEEATRLQKSIYVNRNSLASILLYECPNNIGQLKSDLQLACAKAFLRFKTMDEHYILIQQGDLPNHVKKGLMRLKDTRDDIDRLLNPMDELYRFGLEQGERLDIGMPDDNSVFYDVIERKMDKLKAQGLEDERINEILNIDIEEHFHSYIGTLSSRYQLGELMKVVDEEVLRLTTDLLKLATELLQRPFDEKIFFGLGLHLQGSIERIRKGIRIYHPKLNYVRVTYEEEFIVAMKLAKLIDERMAIETPLDEIGYLTMFLASDRIEELAGDEDLVGILAIMHGHATASSMVQVVNSLLGTEHAKALDMPLTMSAEHMYTVAKDEIMRLDKGKGVLLLVDMGSLTNFGDMVREETGIMVHTLDNASTPLVLEACRKAVLGRDIVEIYKSLKGDIKEQQAQSLGQVKKRIIITACFTGEGASKTLKDIVKKRLGKDSDIEVKTLNVLNKKDFIDALSMYAQSYRILCVISTVQLDAQGYHLIPAIDFMSGRADAIFEEVIHSEDVFDKVVETVSQHIEGVDAFSLVGDIRQVVDQIERTLSVKVSADVKIGILLHTAFMINRLRIGDEQLAFDQLPQFLKRYGKEMVLVQEAVNHLEKQYGVYIGEHEQAYLLRMFVENAEAGA